MTMYEFRLREMLARLEEDDTGNDIIDVCLSLAEFLIDKNKRYGDSALNPVRFHSEASPAEQIRVRMDDKISRMVRGSAGDEDVAKDYVGYWVLLQILERRQRDERQLSLLDTKAPPKKMPTPGTYQDLTFSIPEGLLEPAVVTPGPFEPPPADKSWTSRFGPICQTDGCQNRTGNSDRVICPPCMRKRGLGQHLDQEIPRESMSEGILPPRPNGKPC